MSVQINAAELQLAIGGLGATELLVIFGIVILLFGGAKLPLLGKSLGEGINNFKKSFKDEEDHVQVAEVASTVEHSEIESKTTPKLEDQAQRDSDS